jgi:hypothetical protein
MVSANISILSTFILGAVHSLEPGHGKSILALHTSQSRKWSDGISLLASLLITHFSLTMVVSLILYFNPHWASYDWIRFAAPIFDHFLWPIFIDKKQAKLRRIYGLQLQSRGNRNCKESYFNGNNGRFDALPFGFCSYRYLPVQ